MNIALPQNNEFTRMSLLQANIPHSYYLVDETNNSITIEENLNPGFPVLPASLFFTFTIPVGNYTREQLIAAVQTALTAAVGGGGGYSVPFSVTLDPVTGKVKWEISLVVIYFRLYVGSADMRRYLGLDNTVPTASSIFTSVPSFPVQLGYRSTYISPNSMDVSLNKHDVLFLHCNLANNYGDDIVHPINVTATTSFGITKYTSIDVDATSVAFTNNNTNLVRISLKDKEKKPVNLRGIQWDCVLGFYV